MRLSERRQIKRGILYGYIYVNDKKLKISLAVESRSVAACEDHEKRQGQWTIREEKTGF